MQPPRNSINIKEKKNLSLHCSFASKRWLTSKSTAVTRCWCSSQRQPKHSPLWKLDYKGKSKVTSNTTWLFDSSKPQRPYNTIPWSKTVSSHNPLVTVKYSWSAFAKFHSKASFSLWIRKAFSHWFIFGSSYAIILRQIARAAAVIWSLVACHVTEAGIVFTFCKFRVTERIHGLSSLLLINSFTKCWIIAAGYTFWLKQSTKFCKYCNW